MLHLLMNAITLHGPTQCKIYTIQIHKIDASYTILSTVYFHTACAIRCGTESASLISVAIGSYIDHSPFNAF